MNFWLNMKHETEHLIWKPIFHPKMKILSSFTHPQIVPNLHEFLSSAEQKEDIWKKVKNENRVDVSIWRWLNAGFGYTT